MPRCRSVPDEENTVNKRLALAVALLAGSLAPLPLALAGSVRGCAGPAPGGEWRSYGHDVANSRHQPAEDKITAKNVADLTPRWDFSNGGYGTFHGTPVIAD